MIYSILCVTLLVSFYTDIRNRKILNIVTFPAMLAGLLYYTITLGIEGLLFSGSGLLVGFCLLIIPYLMGGMGAGDVKLMAAIGALTGVSFVFQSFLYTALIGGVIGLLLLIKRIGISRLIKQPRYIIPFFFSIKGVLPEKGGKSNIYFPYGVAITLGTVCAVFLGGVL